MAEQKVNVVGVVLDVLDEKGNIIQEYLEKHNHYLNKPVPHILF